LLPRIESAEGKLIILSAAALEIGVLSLCICLSLLFAFSLPCALAADTKQQVQPGLIIDENTIANAAAAAAPGIVTLDVTLAPVATKRTNTKNAPFDPFSEGKPERMPTRASLPNHLLGSGLIVRPDGFIVTNYHLVGQAQKINVTLHDQRAFKGRVVGKDLFSDLAVVKIDADHLPVPKLAFGQKIRPGDWTIAVGSPLGEDQTVSLGVINAVGRSLTDDSNRVGMIQTDARLSRANSGGPLLNVRGEVIGLASVFYDYAPVGGFAVPVDVVNQTVTNLIKYGSISRPYLGFYMSDANSGTALNSHSLSAGQCVLVDKVIPLGPAEKAGIRVGDYIVKIGAKEVRTVKEVRNVLHDHKPGDILQIVLARNSKPVVKMLTIGDYPTEGSWPKR
jgi:serine protease Do